MKTPKALYPSTRMIYHPEVSSCPQCGGPIQLANYLLGNRIIQTVDTVLSIPEASAAPPPVPAASRDAPAIDTSTLELDAATRRATDLVTDLVRRTRYLLTLKGRPPLRLAGLEAAGGKRRSPSRVSRCWRIATTRSLPS